MLNGLTPEEQDRVEQISNVTSMSRGYFGGMEPNEEVFGLTEKWFRENDDDREFLIDLIQRLSAHVGILENHILKTHQTYSRTKEEIYVSLAAEMEQQFNEISDALKAETERAESAIRMVSKTCHTCEYGHEKQGTERCEHGEFLFDGTECVNWRFYADVKNEAKEGNNQPTEE
jgi:hypothetical protein